MKTMKTVGDFFIEFPGVLIAVGIVMVAVTEVELTMTKIPRGYSDRIWIGNIILSFLIYFTSVWLYKGKKEKEKEDEDERTIQRIFKENEELFGRIKESLSGEAAALATMALVDIAKGTIPKPKMLSQLDKLFGREVVDTFLGRGKDS